MNQTNEKEQNTGTKIKVIGVGGCGTNTVNAMLEEGTDGVEFLVFDTDKQSLEHSKVKHKILIGEEATSGMGASADPKEGSNAAEESAKAIIDALADTDMVFITAGMGGGTGTGAAPVVAEIAKNMGILTIAIVTKPFRFEGEKRIKNAESGVAELEEKADAVVVIPNEKLRYFRDPHTVSEAFANHNNFLSEYVGNIAQTINGFGCINVDFEDLRSVLKDGGRTYIGIGYGTGSDGAAEAAEQAVTVPIIETSFDGARGVAFNITCSEDVSLDVIEQVGDIIVQHAHPEANIILGLNYDNAMKDNLRVAVIAVGLNAENNESRTPSYEELLRKFGEGIINQPCDDDCSSILRDDNIFN